MRHVLWWYRYVHEISIILNCHFFNFQKDARKNEKVCHLILWVLSLPQNSQISRNTKVSFCESFAKFKNQKVAKFREIFRPHPNSRHRRVIQSTVPRGKLKKNSSCFDSVHTRFHLEETDMQPLVIYPPPWVDCKLILYLVYCPPQWRNWTASVLCVRCITEGNCYHFDGVTR